MRNYYIFSVLLSIFCITLIVVGFSIVGSPSSQKAANLDAQRMNDFSAIHEQLLSYFSKKYTFPKNLSQLVSSVTTGTELSINDPETKKQYEYQIVNGYQYKLCTAFSADAQTDKKNNTSNYSSYGYSLTEDAKSLNHKKGTDCILLSVPLSYTSLKSQYLAGYLETPTTKAAKPIATITSLDRLADCQWNAVMLVQGFSPNTEFYVNSKGTVSDSCDSTQTHTYNWTAGPGGESDENGNYAFFYTQKDYGDYTYTLTDLDGHSAAVHFKYDQNSLKPTILPAVVAPLVVKPSPIIPTPTPSCLGNCP